MSTLGVKMTRRVVINPEATWFTSLTEEARSPNRIDPSPGTATEWPSVAQALMTSARASHEALILPFEMPLRRAAS